MVSCIGWCSVGYRRAWPSYVVLTVIVLWGPFGVGTRRVCFCLTGRLLLDLCSILEISVVRVKVSEVERFILESSISPIGLVL